MDAVTEPVPLVGTFDSAGPGLLLLVGPDPMSAPDPMSVSPKVRCQAKSKQTKKPCGRTAIAGGTVCRYHGGAAPQVQKAAAVRLAALTDPAIGVLEAFLGPRKKGDVPIEDDLAFRVAKDVLDRNGFKAVQRIKVSQDINTDLLSDEELEQLDRLNRKALGRSAAADAEAAE